MTFLKAVSAVQTRATARSTHLMPYGVGTVMVLAINVTAVCASALPFSLAPLVIAIFVWANIFPLNSDVVPRVTAPATAQKMFLACAPPLRITLVAELISRVPAIWKIQTAFAPPERVTSVGIVTPELHL